MPALASGRDPAGVDWKFRDQLQEVYEAYLLMNEAFIATDAEKVSERALQVNSMLQKVDMTLLQGESHLEWMDQFGKLLKAIKRIADSQDIADQRLQYALFNHTFYTSLKTFGLNQGTAYYQYCPMANGDEGAYWFSKEKEIKNPYFGDEMLKCGETKETLEFKNE